MSERGSFQLKVGGYGCYLTFFCPTAAEPDIKTGI